MQNRSEADAPELGASALYQLSDSASHSKASTHASIGKRSRNSPFDGLASNYAALMAELSQLGGKLGTEKLSDQIWEQLESIVDKMRVMRSDNYANVIVKLRLSFDFMEETLDPALRALVHSAITDLQRLEAR